MPEVTAGQKTTIWNEYIGTREGRQKLACSFIHPFDLAASALEQGANDSRTVTQAGRTLRNGVRLLGRMALEGEDPPVNFLVNLRRLQRAIEGHSRGPSAWDRLLGDDDPVME